MSKNRTVFRVCVLSSLTPQQEQHPLFMIILPIKEYIDKIGFKFVSVDVTPGNVIQIDELRNAKLIIAFAKDSDNAVYHSILALPPSFTVENFSSIRIQVVDNRFTYIATDIVDQPHITLIGYI